MENTNATVSKKSSVYTKSTDAIQRAQDLEQAEARRIRWATWLLALLIPLAIGLILALVLHISPSAH